MPVPVYPFYVITDTRLSGGKVDRKQKSFETLPAAMIYAEAMRARPHTRRVQVMCILDDWTEEHHAK